MDGTTNPLVARLGALDSNLVSDVMDVGGLPDQVLHASIRPLDIGRPMVGVAVCARGKAFEGAAPPEATESMFAVDAALFPGAVMVLENGGPATFATIGGFVARSWQGLGSTGMLTDSLVRDSGEIIEIGYPIFCRGTCPAATQRRWALVEVGGTADLPGRNGNAVTIRDGDLIIGDRDGVTVVPQAQAEAIVVAAETLKTIEGRIAAMLADGTTRQAAFKANPRFDHVPRFADD